jgi:hypothetical protein
MIQKAIFDSLTLYKSKQILSFMKNTDSYSFNYLSNPRLTGKFMEVGMNKVQVKSVEDVERKAIGQIRQSISHTESQSELMSSFSYNISQYINSIMQPDINVSAQDISFSPERDDHYILSKRLTESHEFNSLWNGTRLPHFVQKVADTTYHRYIHLSHHDEKTRSKIKKGQNLNPRSH